MKSASGPYRPGMDTSSLGGPFGALRIGVDEQRTRLILPAHFAAVKAAAYATGDPVLIAIVDSAQAVGELVEFATVKMRILAHLEDLRVA